MEKKLQKLYELFYPFFVVSETEKRRLQDAFRRSSAANSIISKQVKRKKFRRIV